MNPGQEARSFSNQLAKIGYRRIPKQTISSGQINECAQANTMKLDIPESLQLRDRAIRTALANAARTGGRTGEAAQVLENILLPHLMRETVDVLQPLALLPRLAQGDVTPEMAEVLPQIDKLKSDLHGFHIEHSAILSIIKQLVTVAREEGKSHHVRFAQRLLFRAWLDESVFYPTAILIGRYLKLRLADANDRLVEGDIAPRSGRAKSTTQQAVVEKRMADRVIRSPKAVLSNCSTTDS